MNKIYFTTTNKGKIAALNSDLAGVVEVLPINMDIPEPRSDETSIIAAEKVIYAFRKIKKPCIAQDGGFYILALNGFPRAYVNFAIETIGLEGILKLVEGKNRVCEFRDNFAYLDSELSQPILFETITKGTIANEPRGVLKEQNWGELHKIFIPDGESKTFAEMTVSEIDSWRKARESDWCGRKFARWLVENKKI